MTIMKQSQAKSSHKKIFENQPVSTLLRDGGRNSSIYSCQENKAVTLKAKKKGKKFNTICYKTVGLIFNGLWRLFEKQQLCLTWTIRLETKSDRILPST